MRRLAFFPIVVALVCGCGGADNTTLPETAAGESSSSPETGDLQGDTAGTGAPAEILGLWTNSSCGERKYLRKVNFLRDGTFAAIDEVAPCPSGAQCVWSGIIQWGGEWKGAGDLVEIVPKFEKTGKIPEMVPAGFVILSRSPVSLAERTGEVVCPYQRI